MVPVRMVLLGLNFSFWDLNTRGWSANGSTGSHLFLLWDLNNRGWSANGSTGSDMFLLWDLCTRDCGVNGSTRSELFFIGIFIPMVGVRMAPLGLTFSFLGSLYSCLQFEWLHWV